MGWSIKITSKQEISTSEVGSIVLALPKPLRGPWEEMGYSLENGTYGWRTACDIDTPIGNQLRIGGSYGMSGHIAETMALYLKQELEKKGHEVHFDYYW